jgi:hypothetical protein
MENKLIKCIHSYSRNAIKDGSFDSESVSVYYGFDTYNRNAEHHLELIGLIAEEFPRIDLKDIDFYEITTGQSNRHAHMTMAHVSVPVAHVRERIDEYHIL